MRNFPYITAARSSLRRLGARSRQLIWSHLPAQALHVLGGGIRHLVLRRPQVVAKAEVAEALAVRGAGCEEEVAGFGFLVHAGTLGPVFKCKLFHHWIWYFVLLIIN